MPTRRLLPLLALTTIIAAAATPARTAPAAGDRADELRAVETAFAATMAARDLQAFAAFLDEETVFVGAAVLRGREAVAAAWAPFFADEAAPFSWTPETVVVLDSGDLGLTSGPVLGPDGRFLTTFNSVWRRGADGAWTIVFDKGCPPCGED